MRFFQIKGIDLWGDYGRLLVNGMTGHLPKKNGQLQLERAGPFVPPITFPGLSSNLVVTDEFRVKLASAGLGTLEFQPVIKARIVDLPWQEFDRNADEPLFYPESGEPEDYILGLPHSPSIASSMGDIWQVVLQDGAVVDTDLERSPWDYDVRVHVDTWRGDHLFNGRKPEAFYGRWAIVTDTGKKWFEEQVADWIRFVELPTK